MRSRRLREIIFLLLFSIICGGICAISDDALAAEKPNVLFIAIDDLNDWTGCLGGHPQAKTPNIDRLAQRGTLFRRAHCAAPLCNPSRTALMSGMRPSSTGVYGNDRDWRPVIEKKDIATLGVHFRNNGYSVFGAGKIYHGGFPSKNDWDDYGTGGGGGPEPKGSHGVGGIQFGAVEAEDSELGDYDTADYCIEQLEKKQDKPFFLAFGLHKPHMPWFVPQKYYDMFPLESIVLPKVLDSDLDDVPAIGRSFALKAKDGAKDSSDHEQIVKAGRWKDAVQAYLAAGAYTDMLVGRVLDALDASPYRENTIVVLWGDHGWHLGEKLHWRKNTLWEEATRAPLIFAVPGVTKPGSECLRTVDFMSIYPTLCELCGLEIPKHCEGVSIKSLLANPQAEWDRPAITTRDYGNHSVRSEGWRYIRYADGTEELYDEKNDPMEWTNLAEKPEHAATKSELAHWLPTDDPTTQKGASKEEKQKRKVEKAKKGKKQKSKKAKDE